MVPKTVKIISILGLTPLLFGTMASLELTFIFHSYNDLVVEMSLVYAALVLSFLGGCVFGFEAIEFEPSKNKRIWLSIFPTIWALFSISLPHFVASCLALGFLLVFELDRRVVTTKKAPVWWLSLRFPLTVCVIVMLTIIGFHG